MNPTSATDVTPLPLSEEELDAVYMRYSGFGDRSPDPLVLRAIAEIQKRRVEMRLEFLDTDVIEEFPVITVSSVPLSSSQAMCIRLALLHWRDYLIFASQSGSRLAIIQLQRVENVLKLTGLLDD